MKGLQAIVFDAGNVLINYDEALLLRNIAARAGKTTAEVERYVRGTPHVTELALGKLTGRQFYRIVARDLGFAGNYDEFAAVWCEVLTPIEPMMKLAAQLATRLPRVLLSNTNAIHMQYVTEHFPVLAEFDAQILSHEVGLLKPDPAIFELTLRQGGLEAERTFFVDDLRQNVDAARAVGMQAVQFESAEQVRRELTKLGVLTI
jgi:putative hydrolase of the HAD superfamily